MRTSRSTVVATALFLAAALGLGACTSADTPSSSGQSEQASQSQDASAPVVDRNPTGNLPTVKGAFGEIPEITTVDAEPPTVITAQTLEKGDGAEVGVNDVVTVNYAGFLWDGAPFDSSFGRGAPSTFSLNAVIQGWKYGLAGTHIGDRVLLVVPAEFGYGDVDQGDIPAGSTLIFVVDIIDAFGSDTAALKEATLTDAELPDGLVLEGELGEPPLVSFEEGSTPPTAEESVVVAEGAGPVVTAEDTVIYQYVGTYWGTTEEAVSTWDTGAQAIEAQSSLFLGERVGSRVAMVFPAGEGEQPAMVMIVDILAAYTP